MITQYADSYSNPPSDLQNIVANKVSLLDSYILFQTGQYEYTALVFNNASKMGKEYIFTRGTSNYNSYYSVSTEDIDTFEYTVTNEYYVYSNDGVGKSLDLPVYDGVIAHALVILCCFAMFAVVFKGALFKCLRKSRRS